MNRKEEYRQYLETEQWAQLRHQALERDGYRCRICYDDASEVHHRYYPEEFGMEMVDALTSLCRFCHQRYHRPIEFLDLQEEVFHKAEFSGGTTCPVCTKHVQVYRRSFHKSMAAGLIHIYKYFDRCPDADSVHVEDLMKEIPNIPSGRRGDLSKLMLWGLTERTGSIRCGHYKIVDKGISFVEGAIKVPKYVEEFQSKVIRVLEPDISITEALSGSDFSYKELMS